MYFACLLATLAAFPQDPPHEPTMLERIDALIAKTNACEGFLARYQLHASDGSELSLRIAYRSPADLVIDTQGGEKSRLFIRFRQTSMDVVTIEDAKPASKASITDWNHSANLVAQLRGLLEKELRTNIPAEELTAIDTPVVQLAVGKDDATMNLTFGLASSSEARLGWLDLARRKPERVSLGGAEGKELVLAYSEKSSIFISAETGFLTRIEKRTETGVRCGLELMALEAPSRPSDSEFELPEIGEGALDDTEKLAGIMEGQTFSGSRNDLFRTLARVLDDGRLKWTDESPAKIERVMRALHAVDFGPTCARLIRRGHSANEQLAERVREGLENLDLSDPDVLAEQQERRTVGRQKLEGWLADFLEQEIVNGMPRGRCKARPALYEELAAMERRILSEIYAEQVTKPILAEFDEKVGQQIEPK